MEQHTLTIHFSIEECMISEIEKKEYFVYLTSVNQGFPDLLYRQYKRLEFIVPDLESRIERNKSLK